MSITGKNLVLAVPIRMNKLSVVARYATAVGMVVLAFLVRRLLLGPGDDLPYLLTLPAIILTGYFFQHGTAFFSILLSTLYAGFFVVHHTGFLSGYATNDLIGLGLYTVSMVLVAFFMELLHHAATDLTKSYKDLEFANLALSEAEGRNAMMLREALHRQRNDLQRLAATISMQGIATPNPAVRASLAEAESRVIALASLNGRLDGALLDRKRDAVDSRVFLSGLINDLRSSIGRRPITLTCEAQSHPMVISRAVAIGQVIHELVTNALKYAFPAGMPGKVMVTFRREESMCVLTVEDDGIGIDPQALPVGTGLGTKLTKTLASHLGGDIELKPRVGGGTFCRLTSPITRVSGASAVSLERASA